MELKKNHCTDHLANERTFLAWIRTSIGIIAFGFVIERFSLFIKQMAFILGKNVPAGAGLPSQGYSSAVGIFLVFSGTLISLLAYLRLKKVERQINQDDYRSGSCLDLLLTALVFAVGLVLVIYLSSVR